MNLSGLTVTPGLSGMGYMQTVPLPSAAPLSANGAQTIQVYDADGVRISFVCVKDPNDHFRYMLVDELFFNISGCSQMLTWHHH